MDNHRWGGTQVSATIERHRVVAGWHPLLVPPSYQEGAVYNRYCSMSDKTGRVRVVRMTVDRR